MPEWCKLESPGKGRRGVPGKGRSGCRGRSFQLKPSRPCHVRSRHHSGGCLLESPGEGRSGCRGRSFFPVEGISTFPRALSPSPQLPANLPTSLPTNLPACQPFAILNHHFSAFSPRHNQASALPFQPITRTLPYRAPSSVSRYTNIIASSGSGVPHPIGAAGNVFALLVGPNSPLSSLAAAFTTLVHGDEKSGGPGTVDFGTFKLEEDEILKLIPAYKELALQSCARRDQQAASCQAGAGQDYAERRDREELMDDLEKLDKRLDKRFPGFKDNPKNVDESRRAYHHFIQRYITEHLRQA